MILALSGFGLLALLVFTPWRQGPLDILDFSEFLLQLQESKGFWAGWSRLGAYYASQGRVAEIIYGVISANYQLFGSDSLGWQVAQSIAMFLLPPAAYIVLRRLGVKRIGAVLGASLYVVGTVAATAWLRLTGEPAGTLLMFAAVAMAQGWGDAPPSARRTVLMALCLTAMLLCKETLIACLPFIWLIAASWSAENGIHYPRLNRSTAYCAVACTAAAGMLGSLLLWSTAQRHPGAYASLYGTSVLAGSAFASRVAALALPVFYHTAPLRLVAFPPNFVFILGIALGLLALDPADRRPAIQKLFLAAVLTAGGLVVYLPWPRFEPFYALPFLFGVALGVAVLVDAIATGPRSRLVLIALWLFVLGGSALNAFGLSEFTRAQRQLNYAVAQVIARYPPTDTVVVVSANLTSQPWQNPAATLGRYVRGVGLTKSPPVLRDFDCSTGGGRGDNAAFRHVIQVLYEGQCGDAPQATRTLEESFRYFDWPTLSFRRAAQRVAVLEPPK